MNFPTALVIGPMKSGTTWIQDYLEARGDVALPSGVKETFFFDRHYGKGSTWYATHFERADSLRHQIIMEVAPSYFHSLYAPERVYSLLGDIPLIVTLRDPVCRAWSHYLHLRRKGYTKAPLREAVAEFPEVLEASRYKTCLQRWQQYFGRAQISVLWLEDLAKSRLDYTKRLSEGLQIPHIPPGKSLETRRNEAALPRFSGLAAIGSQTARALRSYRFYGVVNFAKRLGLKDVFFGRPGSRSLPRLDNVGAEWLASELEDEIPEWLDGRQ